MAVAAEEMAASQAERQAASQAATSSLPSPSLPGASDSVFTVLALALVIAFLLYVDNKWSSSVLIALLVFIVVGAIVPPVAVGTGILIIVYLAYIGGIVGKVGNLLNSRIGSKT